MAFTESVVTETALTDDDLSQMVRTQAIIWVPIVLTIITLMTVCTLMGMDADKSRDTILYAKFLSNVKDK